MLPFWLRTLAVGRSNKGREGRGREEVAGVEKRSKGRGRVTEEEKASSGRNNRIREGKRREKSDRGKVENLLE